MREVMEGRMGALPDPDREAQTRIAVMWVCVILFLAQLCAVAYTVGQWAGARWF